MIQTTLKIFVLVLTFAGSFSCQMAPTKGVSQGQVMTEAGQEPFQKFLKLKPVILDTRTPLDFSVSHAPGAILVQWQDFNKVQPGFRGILQDDEFALARRLSLWGIDPQMPVLVVGGGLQGQGEEGRIAWMLKYLGIENVQMSSWTVVRATIPRPELGPENKPIWKPSVQEKYLATPEEFKTAIFESGKPLSKARLKSLQMNSSNARALKNDSLVLDVRETGAVDAILERSWAPVKRISWKKFINAQGLPDASIQAELQKENITPNRMIYVISENGVSSAAVTFILREWGYQAKNFSGGFEFLRRAQQ